MKIIISAITKSHTVLQALSISSLLLLAALQTGCQSMQLGASPIPVIAYSHEVQNSLLSQNR